MLSHPQYVSRPETSRGRDPLGLQSSVMGLYRQVYPGLNNRARYIRVYSAICWMVRQAWDYLGDEPSEDDIQDVFDAAMPKIQLMLVWANTRKKVPALPGSTRKWPDEGETGQLTYQEMHTPSGYSASDADSEDIDGDAGGSDGTSFLGPDEYGPSLTNGLLFAERWPGYRNVLELTEAGEDLADAFEKLLTRKYPEKVEWFRDPYSATITSEELDALWKALRLDEPTRAEQEAFAAQFYPEQPAVALTEDLRRRRDGLTLALRALQAEERANLVPGYVDVERIRHAMARGYATNGAALDLTDLENTQRVWQSLQLRKYLKVALETLFRSCEVRIHHAMVKSFRRDASGKPVAVSRTLESIAREVGELAQDNLRTPAPTLASLIKAFETAQGTVPSLYFAGLNQPQLDLQRNMKWMETNARFQLHSGPDDSTEGDAVASALGALLWCALEAAHLPEESLVEEGDRLTLTVLQELVERFRNAPPSDFVAEVVNTYVLNLHFAVVCERCVEDYEAGRPVKDRYRILLGDDGLERNQSGGSLLTTAEEMRDILLHALYLLTQSGFVDQLEGERAFKLRDAGHERARMDLKALDGSMEASVDENGLVLV